MSDFFTDYRSGDVLRVGAEQPDARLAMLAAGEPEQSAEHGDVKHGDAELGNADQATCIEPRAEQRADVAAELAEQYEQRRDRQAFATGVSRSPRPPRARPIRR